MNTEVKRLRLSPAAPITTALPSASSLDSIWVYHASWNRMHSSPTALSNAAGSVLSLTMARCCNDNPNLGPMSLLSGCNSDRTTNEPRRRPDVHLACRHCGDCRTCCTSDSIRTDPRNGSCASSLNMGLRLPSLDLELLRRGHDPDSTTCTSARSLCHLHNLRNVLSRDGIWTALLVCLDNWSFGPTTRFAMFE